MQRSFQFMVWQLLHWSQSSVATSITDCMLFLHVTDFIFYNSFHFTSLRLHFITLLIFTTSFSCWSFDHRFHSAATYRFFTYRFHWVVANFILDFVSRATLTIEVLLFPAHESFQLPLLFQPQLHYGVYLHQRCHCNYLLPSKFSSQLLFHHRSHFSWNSITNFISLHCDFHYRV